ncbi:MAG: hypothetical protein ACREDO_06950 [Methyloceanibacter sp.]
MRVLIVASMILLMPAAAAAETDIAAVCYADCEETTNSNVEFKALPGAGGGQG